MIRMRLFDGLDNDFFLILKLIGSGLGEGLFRLILRSIGIKFSSTVGTVQLLAGRFTDRFSGIMLSSMLSETVSKATGESISTETCWTVGLTGSAGRISPQRKNSIRLLSAGE